MSSWTKGTKPKDVHKERAQPASRRKMGFLEKKKDYKRRAFDHQRKEAKMKSLRRKARDRNPDEFYFKMVNTHLEDGDHVEEEAAPTYTDEQLKMMKIQDERYLNLKRQMERKKIEKLKSGLHLIDAAPSIPRRHTFFVDERPEEFDVAERLETHPLLLGRTANRPRIPDLANAAAAVAAAGATASDSRLIKERNKGYKELKRRLEREEEIFRSVRRLQVKRSLVEEKKNRKFKVKAATADAPAVYKFASKRKK